MSSWNKASKVNQKVHLERHQPEKRAHLGLLEKHKDYIPRARDFQRKRKTLKKLKEQALNRNPDEYYHHMVNSRLVDDRHKDLEKPIAEDTLAQKKIMENKSLTYVRMKHTQERKKAEKLKAQLHFIDNPITQSKQELSKFKIDPKLIPDTKALLQAKKMKEKSYKKLLKSLDRAKQLAVIEEKMEVYRKLKESKGTAKPKLVVKGTKTNAPVYEWKYERKR